VNDIHAPPENIPPVLFQLDGRIGRVRYLAYSAAFGMLLFVATVAGVAIAGEGGAGFVKWLSVAACAALGLIVGGRRLHDLGRTRWIALALLVPILNLFVGLWLSCAPGERGANRYGPPPAPNSRALILLAWAVPALFVAGLLAAIALSPHKSNAERARDEMEQAI
jgi:uncharacterized membrane protein YhaH (DUF805 family)